MSQVSRGLADQAFPELEGHLADGNVFALSEGGLHKSRTLMALVHFGEEENTIKGIAELSNLGHEAVDEQVSL